MGVGRKVQSKVGREVGVQTPLRGALGIFSPQLPAHELVSWKEPPVVELKRI